LLRHGRTTANADGILAGRSAVALDDAGVAQSTAVADRLAGVPLPVVVTSPLKRCLQTLEAALPSAAPIVDDALTECGYGEWEGQPLKQLAKEPLWRVVQQHPAGAQFPGPEGESMAAMSARAVAAVRGWDARVETEHGPDALWLACSHGDVIKAIVADALGMHLDLFQRLVIEPASITVIRYTLGRPFLLRCNDTGGSLASLVPPKRPRRRRTRSTDPASRAARELADSDAPVGGGSGGSGSPAAPNASRPDRV
jgi:probable phosphomutase (TIGR03848 family)